VVIRPLAYAAEEEIAAFASLMRFPVVPCDLCGSQPNLMRRRVKALISELSAEHPAVKGNLLSALSRVVPSHLLDRDLQRRLGEASGCDPWLDAEAG
jgi:tRNA 2-thiocytidine biosynthesis protein TtcA